MRRSGAILAATASALTALAAALGAACSHANERVLDASDAVFRYERALHRERTDQVRMNGLEFEVESGATTDGVPLVLDRFESICGVEGDPEVRQALDTLGAARPGAARRGRSGAAFRGAWRVEGESRGVVACFGRSPGTAGKPLQDRLRAFLATGDVAEIGPLRLLFVTAHEGTTTYVVLLSKGGLPIARAFPRRGDAPGRDPSGPPRPEGAERRLSVWAPGTSASVFVYRIFRSDPATALSSYRAALSAAGFTVSGATVKAAHLLARAGATAVVASVAPAEGDGAFVTIAVL